jgi:hypothetical protein
MNKPDVWERIESAVTIFKVILVIIFVTVLCFQINRSPSQKEADVASMSTP